MFANTCLLTDATRGNHKNDKYRGGRPVNNKRPNTSAVFVCVILEPRPNNAVLCAFFIFHPHLFYEIRHLHDDILRQRLQEGNAADTQVQGLAPQPQSQVTKKSEGHPRAVLTHWGDSPPTAPWTRRVSNGQSDAHLLSSSTEWDRRLRALCTRTLW